MLLCGLGGLVATASDLRADDTYTVPYAGRLVDDGGRPVSGPVDLVISLWGSMAGEDLLSRAPRQFQAVPLANGLFQVVLTMDATEREVVFGATGVAYAEVKDMTHGRTYRRQAIRWTRPRAAVADAAVTSSGQDDPTSVLLAACLASTVAGAKFVADSTEPAVTCAEQCRRRQPGATCIRGWTLYPGASLFEFGDECVSATVTANPAPSGRLCCCHATGQPLPLRINPMVTH